MTPRSEPTLRPEWVEHFQYALLQVLQLIEPTVWRRRKVIQIRPTNQFSYRERTSYQLLLSSSAVRRAITSVLGQYAQMPSVDVAVVGTALETMTKDPFPVILPLVLLPKRVLLDFSVMGIDDKPLVLLNRYTSSFITSHLIRRELIQFAPPGGEGFFLNNSKMIRAICFLGRRDLVRLMTKVHRIGPDLPANATEFTYKTTAFLQDMLQRFLGRHTSSIVADSQRFEEMYGLMGQLVNRYPRSPLASAPMHHPVSNPLMAAIDYFKLHVDGYPQADRLESSERVSHFSDLLREFMQGAPTFLDELLRLPDEAAIRVLRPLMRFSDSYYAYVTTSVRVDQEFLVKTEQTIPAVSVTPSHWTFGQEYPIILGDTRSLHVEISTEKPTELEQVPNETRVVVGAEVVLPELVFGYSADLSKFHQHFYTTKSVSEFRHALPPERFSTEGTCNVDGHDNDESYWTEYAKVYLRTRYRVERSLCWTYSVATALAVLLTLLFLGFVYVRVVRGGGIGGAGSRGALDAVWIPGVPTVLALWTLLARLRAQETIVLERLRVWVRVAIGCAVVASATALLVGALELSASYVAEPKDGKEGSAAAEHHQDARDEMVSVRARIRVRLPSWREAAGMIASLLLVGGGALTLFSPSGPTVRATRVGRVMKGVGALLLAVGVGSLSLVTIGMIEVVVAPR